MKERYPVGVIASMEINGDIKPMYFTFSDSRTFEISKVERVSKIIDEDTDSLVTLFDIECGGRKLQLALSPYRRWYLYKERI